MLNIINGEIELDFCFPAGEQHICINTNYLSQDGNNITNIIWEYENDSEIFKLLLLVDALRRAGKTINKLIMPYVPHARQDRVANIGEPLSIKVFCDIINSLNINEIVIHDPHSDVTTALLNNATIIPQEDIFKNIIKHEGKHFLLSPDGGALKKIRKSRNENTIQVVTCDKIRDTKTGNIKETIIYFDDFKGEKCIIVDDICDGGKTFIEIAKVAKRINAGEIILCVTHGKFTKGMEVFKGIIDKIYTNKGRVEI